LGILFLASALYAPLSVASLKDNVLDFELAVTDYALDFIVSIIWDTVGVIKKTFELSLSLCRLEIFGLITGDHVFQVAESWNIVSSSETEVLEFSI
jgi:hypothetical protein